MVKYLQDIIFPFGTFFITFFIIAAIRKLLLKRMFICAKKSKTQFDDIIVEAVRIPSFIWCLMIAAYIALDISKVPDEFVYVIGKILFVLGVFSVTIVLANISSKFITAYSAKVETALPVTSLTQNISRIVIFIIGILVILNYLGISITPILATLGVGGLAVALALQDTLSNLFSGFHITISRQIRVGDFIKLETGQEGYVTDINWRTTKVKMLPNNVVLIPNAKLSQAIVVNYYLPDKEIAVLVDIGVHYDSDLKKVEKVTCEVGKQVMREVAGGVTVFEPFIRYHTFGDFSINFTVILRAKEFVDQYLIKHEFIKRLHERYAQEKIIIPYPIRAINYEQEKAG